MPLDAENVDIISLSHPLSPQNVCLYPGDPEYRLRPAATFADDGYALNYVSVGEHTGTHWGAPSHFNEDQPSADELDPRDFFLPAAVVDVRQEASRDPDYAVGAGDLRAWTAEHGPLPQQCAVILNTGWHRRWPTPGYANLDGNGVPHHPGFSVEALHWLMECGALAHRGALGTDAFSPDVGRDDTFAVSKLLYREHRLSLEVLANLDRLPPRGFWVFVGGFIATGGTGSPAAIYGLVPSTRR